MGLSLVDAMGLPGGFILLFGYLVVYSIGFCILHLSSSYLLRDLFSIYIHFVYVVLS